MIHIRPCTVVVCAVALVASTAAAQDEATVKSLYESARYRDALAAIDQVNPTSRQPLDRARLHRYRALCLVAINRSDEAEAALADMIRQAPLATIDEPGVPPSVERRIAGLRARILPELVQTAVSAGRAAFDRQVFEPALEQFELAIALADASGSRDTVADWRALAAGFRDLAAAELKPAAAPAPEEPAPVVRSGAKAPAAISQPMPAWPRSLGWIARPARAVVELSIGTNGHVSAARIVKGIHPVFDQLLLAATRSWRYQPARSSDGNPRSVVNTVEVVIK